MLHYDQFIAYVEKTSRPITWEKRRGIFAALTSHQHANVNALVSAVGGNSKDHAWASRALEDGVIVKDPGGFLKPGRAQTGEPDARPERTTFRDADEALRAVCEAAVYLRREGPEHFQSSADVGVGDRLCTLLNLHGNSCGPVWHALYAAEHLDEGE